MKNLLSRAEYLKWVRSLLALGLVVLIGLAGDALGLNADHYRDEFVGWQENYFGSTNAAGAGYSDDFDGDTFNNWAEFCAGTDPTNDQAYLILMSSTSTVDSHVMSWSSVDGRNYDLLASDDLAGGSFSVVQSNITATVPENIVVATPPLDSPTRYYRIAVSDYQSVYSAAGILPPTNVVASDNLYTDKVVIAWSAVSNATAYYVYRYLDNDSPAVGISSSLSFEDRGGTAGRTYYYRVKSFHPASGLSGFSSSADGYRAKYLSPYVPTDVSASAGAYTDRISLNWSPVDDAERYYIYRNSGMYYHTYYLVGDTVNTSYEDFIPEHSNDFSYNYLVLSYNEERGLSDQYDINKDYRTGYLNPGPPTGVRVTRYGNYLNVRCDEIDDSSMSISYHFYRSTSPDGPYEFVGWGSGNSHSDLVDPGTIYYYKVRARMSSTIYSDYSDYDSNYRDLTISYGWGFSASDGDYEDYVLVTWDQVPGAAGYYIYRGLSSTGALTRIGEATDLSFNDQTASENTEYYYKVNPHNELSGEYVTPYVTAGYKALKAPVNLSATAGTDDDGINLTWDPVYHAETYYLRYSDSPTGTYSWLQDFDAPGRSSFRTTVPARGKVYYFKMASFITNINWTPYSDVVSGYWKMLRPGAVNATDGDYEDRIRFSWSGNTNATLFHVYRGLSYSGDFTEIGTTSEMFYDDTTVLPGKQYSYKVSAYNEETGHSPTSTYCQFGYAGTNPPAPPVNVIASDGAYTNQVVINWDSPSYADKYVVYRSTTPGGTYIPLNTYGNLTNTLYVDTNVDAEVTVYYKIAARTYSCGYSDLSAYDAGHAQGGTAPAAPGGVVASDGGFTGYVRISWDAVTDAERYDVYHATTPNGLYSLIRSQPYNYGRSYDHTNTALGATNYYRVKSYSAAGGSSGFSETDGGYRGLALPQYVAATDGDYYEKVRVEWSRVSLADGYHVFRSSSPGSGFSLVANTTDTDFEDTPPLREMTYYYKVQAYDATWGYSAASTPDAGFAQGSSSRPAAPANIFATDGAYDDYIRVDWDRDPEAANYYVYRSTAEAGPYVQIAVRSNYYSDSYNDSSVTVGETYYYKVKTFCAMGGFSEFSSSDDGYAGTAIVSWLGATKGTTDDGVRLYWNAVTGSERYHIYRSTSETGPFSEITVDTSSPYDDTNVIAGVTYYYRMKAYDSVKGYSAFSQTASGYMDLQGPSYMYASDGLYDDRIELSWAEVNGAERYYIYRAASCGEAGALIGNAVGTTFDDLDVEPGTTYYYKVKAYSTQAGYSEATYCNSGYVGLAIPGSVTASDGIYSNYVRITWGAVPGAQEYYVYRGSSLGGSYSCIEQTASLSCDDASVYPGSQYYYKVQARNTQTRSDFSESDQGSSASPAQPPPAPYGLSAASGTTQAFIRVSWWMASGATRYHVYRSTAASGAYYELGDTAALFYDDCTAVADVTYYYKVKAYNADGYSDFRSYCSGYRVDPATPPAVPVGLVASDGVYEDRVHLSWDAVTNATRYYVFRSDFASGQYTELGSTASVSFDDRSASPGNRYYYRIKSANAVGRSDLSAYQAGSRKETTILPPAVPTGVTASDGTYTDRIRLSWDTVAGADRYYIYRSTTAHGTYQQIGRSLSLTYDDAAVGVGTYYYKIRSYSIAGGYSDYSSAQSGSRQVVSAGLDAPVGVSASDGLYTNRISIRWSAVSGAEQYYVYRSTASLGTYTQIGTVGSTECDDTTGVDGTVYYYKVKAYSATQGTSGFSSVDDGHMKSTVVTAPDTPAGVSATDGTYTDRVRVSWNAVTGADQYYIYRSTSANGIYSQQDYTTALNYDDSSAVPGVTYYYKVRSYRSAGGYSGYSTSDQGHRQMTTAGEPTVPTGLSASDGTYSDRVRLTWNAAANADEYRLFRRSSPTAWDMLVATTESLSYDDTAIEAGNNYYYAVEAYNRSSGRYSDKSSREAGYMRTAAELIAAPTGVAASDDTYDDRIRVTWNAVSGATRYIIYRSTPNHSDHYYREIASTTSLRYDDQSVDATLDYRYKIKAQNSSGGYSYYSDYDEGIRAFPSVSGIAASDGLYHDRVEVTWNTVDGASQYIVYRSASAAGPYSEWGSAYSAFIRDRTVVPGVMYYYKVKSYSSSTKVYSDLSRGADSGFARNTVTAPAVPSGVSASDGSYSDRVQISWSAASGAERYYLYRSDSTYGSYVQVGTTTGTSFNDTSANGGSTYYYKVRSHSAAGGYSDLSAYDAGYRSSTPPSTPSGVSASDATYTDYVRISWNAVSSADRYYLYRSTSSYGTYSEIGRAFSTSYDDAMAVPGVTYYYKVKAYNVSGGGYSDYSSYNAGSRQVVATPPSAPTGVSAEDGSYLNRIRITWNTVSGAERYYVYRSTSAGGMYSQVGHTLAAWYDDSSAAIGVVYYYKVKSYTAAGGYSGFSDYDVGSRADAAAPPATPTGVTASDGASYSYVEVNWNSVSGADKYYIYRSESLSGAYMEIGNRTSATYGYTDYGVESQKTYYYKVKAYDNNGGYSAFSSADSGYAELPAPTELRGNVLADRIDLSWNPIGVAGSVTYELYRSTSAGGPFTKIASLVSQYYHSDRDVSGSSTYYYRLRASHASYGYSDYATASFATLYAAPQNLLANGQHPVRLSWSASSPAATRYHIYRMVDDGPLVEIATTTGTYYDDTTTEPCRKYQYRVAGYHPSYGYSDSRSCVTYVNTSGGNVYNLRASGTYIMWHIPESYNYCESVHLYRSDSPGGPYVEIHSEDPYQPSGEACASGGSAGHEMENAKLYYYKMRAYYDNDWGFTDYTDYVSTARLDGPYFSSISYGTYSDRIRVSLVAIPEASEYIIYRRTEAAGGYEEEDYTEIGRTSSVTFDDFTAVPGVRYLYAAKAVYSGLGASRFHTSSYYGVRGQ